MRLVSLSAAVAALTLSLIVAPYPAGADDVTRPGKERRVRQVPASRHWGADNLIPVTPRSGPRDRILPDAVVEYNTATNRIAVIRPVDGVKGIPVAGTASPKDAAEKYLRANHEALGLTADLSELHLVRERESGDSMSFSYEQRYQGIPVFGGNGYVVAKKHALLLVSMHIVPVSSHERIVAPADPAPAIKAVIDDVSRRYPSKGDERYKPRARFGLLVREGVPTGAWEVDYRTADDEYRGIVDAASNEVLSAFSPSIKD